MELGVVPLAKAFREGTDDPVRALDRALDAARRGKDDRAILSTVPSARPEAEWSRDRLRRGDPLGPLDGVPMVVKDAIDIAGLPTSNGTSFLREPARADAPLVTRLRAAGAVIFAKTNMHELGIQPTGINPHLGTPVNPWDPLRIPGGSSAGSAVAVASGIAPIGLGTDAGGSVRIPAIVNGLVGLKPTHGSVPLQGVAALTEDLDHVGPLAWTVEDATLLFEVLAGRAVDRGVSVTRAALLSDFLEGSEEPVVRAVRGAVAEVFGALDEVRTPFSAWAAAVEFVIVAVDAQKTAGPHLAQHAAQIAPDTRMILRLGMGLPPSDRDRAERMRSAMRVELDELLGKYEVLIGPAVGCFPPALHPKAREFGELDTRKIAQLAAVTFVTNLTGHPCCVVPCVRDGLPMGVQIIGRHGDEARVLSAARRFEEKFGPRKPPRWHGS
jgi:Asp-tRNA(Asn)/Glu-tRNA(Gln) amidotransferase A subunit family amidase